LAAIASLGNVWIVNRASHVSWATRVTLVVLIKSIETCTGEWSFLPDVVLATVSIVPENDERTQATESSLDQRPATCDSSIKSDIQYGTLISCIDFGDQLGALLAGPFVSVLGISRENDWAGMDTLIQLCSLGTLLSIGFIAILR
jgi:hypothetical protein